jgi:cyanophycinase
LQPGIAAPKMAGSGRSRAQKAGLVGIFVLSAAAVPAPGAAGARLVLFGGGDRPAAAMARFVGWAGGKAAHVLVVPWASIEPAESCRALEEELRALGVADVACAPLATLDAGGKAAPLGAEARAAFAAGLARATGVYFCGGDQSRVMDALADRTLVDEMKKRQAAGVVFAGTSAGTAVMSGIMITGEGDFTVIDGGKVETRDGLGLIPGAIVDQHFVKRQRENRLFGLVLAHPALRGVGIDESTVLLVDGERAEVEGAGVVVLVDALAPDRLEITLVRAGQTVDLRRAPGPPR